MPPNEQDLAQKKYNEVYTMGVRKPLAFVMQMEENKHGIENKVTDLDVSQQKIIGNVTFDGSAIVNPPVTITLQNQDGVLALQEQLTLTATQVLFANSDGLIVQDADMSFSGNTLTVTNLSTGTTIGNAYIYRVGGTDVSLADGGTGSSLADPGVDSLLGWDDTDDSTQFINIGTGLTYNHGTHTLSSDAVPGGSDTQLQFNDNGVFGGAKIEYTEPFANQVQLKIENQTVTDTNGYYFYIEGSNGNGTGIGGDIQITAGRTAGGTYGADFYLAGAAPTGNQNSSYFAGTYAPFGTDGNGGDIYIYAGGGDGVGTDGNVIIGSPGYLVLDSNGSSANAILNADNLSDANKIFTFPDQSGTFALQEKFVVNLGEVITNDDEVIFIN